MNMDGFTPLWHFEMLSRNVFYVRQFNPSNSCDLWRLGFGRVGLGPVYGDDVNYFHIFSCKFRNMDIFRTEISSECHRMAL